MPKTYVVEVAPLDKTSGIISYFSTSKLKSGTLVRVNLRGKTRTAVVLSSRAALREKSLIRKASFQLKKIRVSDILDINIEPKVFRAIEEVAKFSASYPGTVISLAWPKFVLEKIEKYWRNTRSRLKSKSVKEPLFIQMESAERFGQYRLLVRQNFAKKGSVIFLVPTKRDVEKAYLELSRGVAEFTYTFSSSKKEEWHKALENKHPILFITTPQGLLLPRSDISLVVVDRENSRAYRSLVRPYLSWKKFAEYYAGARNIDLVMGDAVLSLESLWREKNSIHHDGESSLVRWRLAAAPTKLVSIASKMDEGGHFEIFSRELRDFIQDALEENEKVFLFGARKGLFPTTVCGDCGLVLPCQNCGAPVVLHRRDKENFYICHACSEVRDPKTTCPHCKSWKLVPLGIGTQEIARQASFHFRGANVEILDKDHAPTESRARKIIQSFEEKGGILVGTELSFFYLNSVPYSAVVSLDSLFSVPDFGINERIFYLISHLRELTERAALLQSRNIGKQILAWAAAGNIIDFYQNEIREREDLLYPPFSIFIKVENRDGRWKIQDLVPTFEKWAPDFLKNSMIIRLPRDKWPDVELSRRLSLLPPQFAVKVDPESIL